MMNPRNAPLSPVSVGGGSEWSVGKYNNVNENSINNNNNNPSSDYFQPGRGQFISPPNSGGVNGSMNGFPPAPRSLGGPSPPPSIGRQSNGAYARSESGRSPRDDVNWEVTLGEHYLTFKAFLSNAARSGKPPQPPNKARDKLLRLTLSQFLELSTDVYDELRRRQDLAAGRPAPDKLVEEEQYHEKRNEARGKLKYLTTPRFRDLATDVFLELERRFPRFTKGDIPRNTSPTSARRPSRTQTPVNGNGITGGFPPPRSASRMRRPSDASSVRSGAPPAPPPPVQGLGLNGNFGGPPSPPRNDPPPGNSFDRPLPKQLGSNTIVPNKSTMVEEDDDGADDDDDREPFGLESATTTRDSRVSGTTQPSAMTSEADKKLIDDYQIQVRDLRDKLDSMEDAMKRKDDEMNNILDGERSRATASNLEKNEWDDVRNELENKLEESRDMNGSLQGQLDGMRNEHDKELQDLKEQLEDVRQEAQQAVKQKSAASANRELFTENQELRMELQEQQRLTEEVHTQAQQSLREMKELVEQSGGNWQRQAEMEKTIEQLEREVRDWRNRYARTKTQLRNMRASSMGLTIEQDVSKYVKDKGFAEENGLVKDVHVTKFQIAIDEFLRGARVDNPEKVTETMKGVVVSVRRITKDIDESAPKNDDFSQLRSKLKGRVSSTANNLITSSKNFAGSAGISPVSILDAAASHLVTAVVELLRTVKIRATPAGELEDDDDGTMTPVDSTGFFSPRSTVQTDTAPTTTSSAPGPPPPFQGLHGFRASIESSAYSPANSPRESVDPYPARRPISRSGLSVNGGYLGMQKNLPPPPVHAEEVSGYLDTVKDNIQNLVQSIRDPNAPMTKINEEIDVIGEIIGRVIQTMEASGNGGDILYNLQEFRQRLYEAGEQGQDLVGSGVAENDNRWGMWKNTLPPIAFGVVREMKELLSRVDQAENYS
ncbi:hypothetical protein MKZ38_001790 [Zalerion maritima]|uniref:GIT Spa2 homology (SHD) domain-containing protein n=1 Tax=Zalerion maritima TaxID=339359 RepID=A0AAD5RYQ5_9PEZI|nr:hypothetical protein MKZ38_001790 [Zalerion maritima]